MNKGDEKIDAVILIIAVNEEQTLEWKGLA